MKMSFTAELLATFAGELHRMPPKRALRRLLRCLWVLRRPSIHTTLSASPSLRHQHTQAWEPDPFFYVACRHYLIQGLTPEQRVAAALAHYAQEDALPASYRRAVYDAGLVLWSKETETAHYEMRLTAARGVLYEGGLSVSLHADGVEACWIAFSVVPSAVLGLAGPEIPGLVALVSRIQQARDHSWQAAFNKAFNHTAASRLAIAALAGVAMARGVPELLCIKAERHPNFVEERRNSMVATYDEFWATMAGRDIPGLGRLVSLPLDWGPVDHLDRSKRKRALARRAHIARVSDAAQSAVRTALDGPQRVSRPAEDHQNEWRPIARAPSSQP